MAAPVNDFDTLLQAEPVRTLAPRGGVILSATTNTIAVNGTTPSVALVTLVATLLSSGGTLVFTTSPTVPLGVDPTGRIATLRYADMGTSSVTVTATLTANGLTYTDSRVISQVSIGSLGYTGALNATANNSAQGPLANRPVGANGDFYFATDALVLYQKTNGAWTAAGTQGAPAGTYVGTTLAQTVESNASTAKTDAAAALTALATIASDSVLSKGEKPAVELDLAHATSEYPGIVAQATNMGLDSSAYTAAYNTNRNYLINLTGWADRTVDTNISASTFQTNWTAYYTTRQALLNAMAAKASTMASGVTLGSDGKLLNAGGGQVTLPGMGQNVYRVISKGNNPNAAPPAAPGFYKNGVLLYGGVRSYVVVTVRRSDGAVTPWKYFDVYSENNGDIAGSSGGSLQMAAYLNSIGNDYIVVVYSYDEPRNNRGNSGLDAAMYRHGASRAVFGSSNVKSNSAYVLIGIGACGEGNGAEGYQGTVDYDANAWVDMSFTLLNGSITVSNGYTPRSLTDYGYSGDLNANYVSTGKGASLNEDPLFDNPAAWSRNEGPNIYFGTDAGQNSIYRKYLGCAAGTDQTAIQIKPIALDPSKTYNATALVYAAPGNNRDMYLFLDFYDLNGNQLLSSGPRGSRSLYPFGGQTPTGVWTRQGSLFGAGTTSSIPAGTAYAKFGIWFQYSGGGNSSVIQAVQDMRIDEVTRITDYTAPALLGVSSVKNLSPTLGTFSSPGTARTEISDLGIRIYDGSGALRIKLGIL